MSILKVTVDAVFSVPAVPATQDTLVHVSLGSRFTLKGSFGARNDKIAAVKSRDVEAEAEAGSGSCGSGTFYVEAEAVPLKRNRFRFHSDQGFPTEGEFHTWEEFYS